MEIIRRPLKKAWLENHQLVQHFGNLDQASTSCGHKVSRGSTYLVDWLEDTQSKKTYAFLLGLEKD